MANALDEKVFDLVEGGQPVDLFLDENTIKAREIREGIPPLIGPDGRPSTHIMSQGELTDEDGNPIYIAFPTLFFVYEDKEAQVSRAEWKYLPPKEDEFAEDAYQEALIRDEVFYFDTEQEARDFALGSWKPEEDK